MSKDEKPASIVKLDEITINNIEDCIEIVKQSQAIGSQVWWRGHSVAEYKLVPGVFRKEELKIVEREMLAVFKRQAYIRHKGSTPAEGFGIPANQRWMFLAQHYRLVTRLLDWTESPLVAMYFALEEDEHSGSDGMLWSLNPNGLNSNMTGKKIGIFLPHANEISQSVNRGFLGKNDYIDEIYAVWPDEFDLRMMIQYSAFTIHNSVKPLEEYDDSSQFLRGYRIPTTAKLELKKILRSLGFKKSKLFPDLEHLAKELNDSLRKG